jgi:hypothetical protein
MLNGRRNSASLSGNTRTWANCPGWIGRHNFISYALRAAKKMNEPAIRKQVKQHWKKLNAEVKKAQAKIGS